MIVEHAKRRLLREYLELPGLSLSLAQTARLLSVDASACKAVLKELVNARCLAQDASGTYVRGDLERWKSLVRNRLAAATQAAPSLTRAVSSLKEGPSLVRRRRREAHSIG